MEEYLIFFLIQLQKKFNLQLVSYSSFLLGDSDAWSFIGAYMQLLKKNPCKAVRSPQERWSENAKTSDISTASNCVKGAIV